jgi:hypothetical protein
MTTETDKRVCTPERPIKNDIKLKVMLKLIDLIKDLKKTKLAVDIPETINKFLHFLNKYLQYLSIEPQPEIKSKEQMPFVFNAQSKIRGTDYEQTIIKKEAKKLIDFLCIPELANKENLGLVKFELLAVIQPKLLEASKINAVEKKKIFDLNNEIRKR